MLWILAICGVAAAANWYYPQKLQPQIEAAQQAEKTAETKVDDLLKSIQEKDSQIAAAKQDAETARAQTSDISQKFRAMEDDYKSRLQKEEEAAAAPKVDQPLIPDVKPVGIPSSPIQVVQAPVPTLAPAEKKGLSEFDLKQVSDLKGDIANAQQKLKESEDDLKHWDGAAYVDEDGILRGASHVHKRTTNAVGEINDARKRIKDDQAQLAGFGVTDAFSSNGQ